MTRKYIICIFNKIEDETGRNVLEGFTYIPCFNKGAYFKVGARYYRIDYPDVRSLKAHERKALYRCSGLHAGIYGTMAECYGKVKEIGIKEYTSLLSTFPLLQKDLKVLALRG
jgi:hypothetical protein